MPTQTPKQGKLFRSTPRTRLRRTQGVLRAVTGIITSMLAGLCPASFVFGRASSGRGASLRSSRGIYIRAQLSASVLVLALGAVLAVAGVLHPTSTSAATSDTVNFQARLMSNTGAIAPDGNYNIQFKLYNASTGGTALWTETWYDSNGTTAGNDNRLRVANGYLTVNLGAQNPFPSTINWAQNLYVTMNVGGSTQTATPTYDGEMNPRLKLTAVPYAFSAGNLSNVSSGGFTSTLNFQGATGQDQVIQIPNDPLHSTDDLCLYSLGNCAGAGGGITGSGTQNYVAKFDTSGSHIGNSSIFDDGTIVGIGTASGSALVNIQGSSASNSTLFTQAAANATVATDVIQQSSGQTGNLIEFRDAAGNVNGSVNATGNILSLGRVAGSGTVSQGKITLADGTTDNFGLTLVTDTLTANSTVKVPNAGGNDTVCLYTLANCVGSGGGIAGAGTQNYLAKFDTLGGNHLGNASLYDNGSFVGLNTTSNNGLLSIQGSGTTQSSLFVQGAASASAPTIAIEQATSQGGDLLQLVNSAGTALSGFLANGNFYYANSGFKTTLSTETLTSNQLVELPNETGTLCIQSSTSCGFELTTGTDFIRNGTTNQTANFAIQSAGTGSVTAKIQALSGQTADLLNLTNSSGTVLTNFDTNGFLNINNTVATSFSALNITSHTNSAGAININNGGNGYALTANSGIIVTDGTFSGSLATQKGSDYGAVGVTNNVSFGAASLYRLTGTSAQTITGIAGGVDGRQLTLVNAATTAATLSNNSASSTTTNRIITGTGSDLNLPAGASISLIYDSTAGFWRVNGSVAYTGGAGANTIGAISGTSNANGATITGSTLNLTAADATNGGVVSNTTQTFAGDKTFSGSVTATGLLTGNSGLTVVGATDLTGGLSQTGGAVNLQANAASQITTSAGNLTLDSAATLALGTTNATAVTIGHSGVTTTIQGSTSVSLGSGGTALVCSNSGVLSSCTNSYEATTGTDFIRNGTTSQTANFTIQSASASSVGGIIQGASGQTSDLFQVKDSTGAVLTKIDNGGRLFVDDVRNNGSGAVTFNTDVNTQGLLAANGGLRVASGTDTDIRTSLKNHVGNLVLENNAATSSIVVKGAASQSADLFQIQDSSGTVLSKVDASGNLSAVGGTFSGSLATQKGTDFATTGSSNNVSFGTASLYRLTGASAQTITGIAGGVDGRQLTLVNAAAQAATISNNSTSSTATNRIVTGTGSDLNLPAGASISLIYDSAAGLWRVNGSVAYTGAAGVNAVGAISGTSNANGATITGTTINLTAADSTNGGVVSNTTQTFAGNKTFSGTVTATGLLTGNGGLTVAGATSLTGGLSQTGGAVNLQANAASQITTSAGNLTLDSAATLQLGTTNATAVTIGHTGVTTTIQGNTAVTLSGTTGGTLVCSNASSVLSTCTNSYETTTGTDFVRNQSASAQSANFFIQGAASTVSAVIQGASGQDITDFKLSGGTNAVTIDASGQLNANNNLSVKTQGAVNGTGTVTTTSLTVTGTGTTFGTDIHVGDVIIISGQARLVSAIASATSLTVSSGFSPVIGTATAFTYQVPSARIQLASGQNSEGLQVLDSTGTRLFAVTSTGNATANRGLTVTSGGSFATQRGTDYSTVGVTNDVGFGSAALYRLTGASAQTITGIAAGSDGRQLTLVNAAAQAATLKNNDTTDSSAANVILTGTGGDLSIPAGASIQLIYDSSANVWRVTSGVAATGGVGVNTVGAISGTSNANGATITGTTINLTAADATNGGVVSNTTQTFAGNKTFSGTVTATGLLTGNAGLTVAGATSLTGGLSQTGGAVNLQANAASQITTSAGNLTLDSAATLALGTTNATAVTIGRTGVTTTIQGSTAVTLSGTSGGTLVCSNASSVLSTCTNTYAQTNDTTNFIRNQTSQQASSNFNISGTGIANILQAGTFDTASAAALNVGTTNATSIALGRSGVTTTVTGGLTQTTGAISLTGNATSSLSTTVGNFALDAAATVNIGTTNATNVTIGRTGQTISLNGAATASAGITIANSGAFATQKGTDYSTTGTSNDVAFGAASLYRLTGASAQTITGIAGGTDGRQLTLINAGSTAATISNNSASSTATDRIVTGTGGDVLLPAGASVQFIYDSTAGFWRATSSTAATGGAGVNTIGTFAAGSSYANGAQISGTTLTFGAADGSNPGLVSTGAQTLAGAKTFSALVTGSAGLSVSGGAVSLTGNAASSLTTTSGALTLQGTSATNIFTAGGTTSSGNVNINTGNTTSGPSGAISIDTGSASSSTSGTISIGAGNASAVAIGHTGITTTIQGSTAVTLSGTTGGTLVCSNASSVLSTCTNSYETTAGTDFIQNQNGTTQTGTFKINGTGTAATFAATTSVLTNLLDGTTAGSTLAIGTTTATGGINLNQSTTLLGGKNFVFGSGAGSFDQSASTGTFKSGSGAVSLNGDTTVATGKNLTVTSGATSLTGASNATALNVTASGTAGVAATFQGGNVGIGVSAPNAMLQVQAQAAISSGSVTLTATSGSKNFTTSASLTLNRGDYLIPTTSTSQGNLVSTTATGTSFTGSFSFSSSISAETFTIYRAATNINDGAGNSALRVQGNGGVSIGDYVSGSIGSGAKLAVGGNAIVSGVVYTTALSNLNSASNATINLNTTGTSITRNIADSNAALIVNQVNASSTGDIAQFANNSGTVAKITQAGLGSFTGVTSTANITVTSAGSVATQQGTDYSTTGTSNNVAFGTAGLYRLTGASAQTITGIAGGIDGRQLTLVNAGTTAATIKNNDTTDSSAANVIITGTGNDAVLPAGASVQLIYDATTNVWRITSGVASTSAAGVNTIGTFAAGTSYANGAQISGTTLTFGAADGTNPGLVSTAAQTLAGAKTFAALITGQAGISTTGGAVSLQGNAASSLTTTSGNLTVDAAAALQLGGTNATSIALGHSGITTTITGGLTQNTGVFSLQGNGASTITTTSGNTTVDSAATLNLGTTNATALALGHSGVTTTITGGLTQNTGAVSLTANAASQFSTTTGSLTFDAASALNVGQTNSTSVAIGHSGITTTITGGLTQTTGAISLTGNTASTISTTTGNFSLDAAATVNIGTTNATNVTVGRSGQTISLNGATTAAANVSITNAGALAVQKGTDYSTTGSANDVAFGTAGLYRLTGASAQTITGIAGGVDGRQLTLVNAGSTAATISNNSASSSAANRIITGTGSDVTLPAGASLSLVYDSGASFWRVTGSVAYTGAAGINTIGAISATSNANGATISGTTLNLTAADGTNGGVVTNTTQTFAGAKTFTGLITGQASLSVTGTITASSTINGATISGGTLSGGTFSGGSVSGGTLTSGAVNSLNVSGTAISGSGSGLSISAGGTNQNISLDSTGSGTITIGHSGTTTTIAGNTAVTLGASGTTLVCTNGSSVLSTCTSSYETTTGTDFIQNQTATTQTAGFKVNGNGTLATLTANTSVLTNLLDATTAGATLAIGTTNATGGISLNQNTTLAAGKNLSFATGAGNFDQSNSTGTFATGTGNVSLNGDTTVASGKKLTAGSINTTAGQATSLGNSTGNLTVTGNSASTFVINGATIDATEFGRLDGKDAPLVDTNDAVATAITGTGTLTTGSINWSGAIVTSGNISTSGTGTITSAGVITANGGITIANTGSLSTSAGTSFTTAGTSTNAALNTASFYTLNTSGAAQVIQGITAGRDGQRLTLTNINALAVTLANNSGSATGAKIVTGTGADVSLPNGASVELIYDATGAVWRVAGAVAAAGGYTAGVTNVGAISGTSNANGATITGTTLNLTAADGTNGGVVTNTTQTLAGAKTFAALITGQAGISTSGGAVSLQGNSASSLTTTSGNLTVDAAAVLQLGNINATSLALGHSGITTTVTGGLTQSTGVFNLQGNAASTITTTSGNTNIDSAATVNLGVTNATAVALGHSGVTTTVTGGLTQNSGAVSLTGNSASSFTTSAGALTFDAATALSLGQTNSTSVAIGRSGITTTITGGLTQSTGAISLTGNAASTITTTTGNFSLDSAATVNVGTTTATNVTLGRSGQTISLNGATTAAANVSITNAGALAVQKGTDYSTTGVTNNVAFGNAGLYRLTGSSTQTITGIAGGVDGRQLTLVNAAAQATIIKNNDVADSTAGNLIFTGTGSDISLPAGASLGLVYDAGSNVWRVTSGVAASGGVGVNTIGSFNSATSYANGAQISGTTLTFGAADGTNPGLVSTAAQTLAGAKTFSALITGQAGISTSGGAVSLQGNAASSLTTTSGNLTVDSAAALQLGGSNATSIALGRSGITTTVTGGLSQQTGVFSLQGNGASTITTTSGNTTVDSAATLNLGNGSATALAIGRSGVTTTVTGNLTQTTGAVSLSANAASSFTTSAGSLTFDATTALNLGQTNSTNVAIGHSGITTTITGALTQTTGAINLTGNASSAISTTTGNFSLDAAAAVNIGTTNATNVTLSRAGQTITLSGATTSSAGITLTNGGAFATQKGTDYSTTGVSNNVNFGTGSLYRLTGATSQTITGIANGVDGRQLTLVNATANVATIKNNDTTDSSATNVIVTGTGGDVAVPAGASIQMIYDAGNSVWRLTSSVAAAGGAGVNTVGAISATSNANGATITGTTLNLTAADGTNGGVVTNTTQTLAGAKTFAALITGQAGISTTGGAVSLQGNAASSLTTTSGNLTVDAAAALQLGSTNSTSIALGHSGITTTITGGLTQNTGVFSLQGSGSSTITTTSGNTTVDSAANLNLGNANATALSLGHSGVTTTVTGGLSQNTGAVSLAANAASSFTTSAGALTFDAAAALNLGQTNSTSVAIGHSGITTTITGALTQTTGAVSLTGNAASSISTTTGNFSLDAAATVNVGTTNATNVTVGRSGQTISLNGATTASANVSITNAGSFATAVGAAFTTAGTSSNAALNTAGFYTLNTSGAAQVLQGITAGRDGQHLTLTNINASAVTLANNNAGATGSKIITGTGADVTIVNGASIELIYDATASVWRVTGGVAATGGVGINTVGAISATGSANGATITGTTLNLTAADATNGGVVSNTTQTFAGAKTFAALITGNAGLSVTGTTTLSGALTQSGGAISLQGNAASSITTTSGNLTLDSAATLALGTTNATGVTIGRSTTTTTIQGTTSFAGGATISAFLGGSWLDLPTTGPSGIGTGGAGQNTLLGYAAASDQYFTGALTGDTVYRNANGKRILIGIQNATNTAAPQIVISNSGAAFSTPVSISNTLDVTGATTITGNLTQTGGTISLSGATTAAANISITNAGSFATAAGASFTTAGTSSNAALNVAGFYTLNTSGTAQVIQGITAGRDGQHLTLTNINALAVTLANNNASATGAKIITGTGADVTVVNGAAVELIYDATASVWRVTGGVAAAGGVGVNTVGAISATSNANGATITGTTLNLTAADGTNGGVVTNTTQTLKGAKTFSDLLTGNAGATIGGGAVSLSGNATSSFTTSAGTLNFDGPTITLGTGTATNINVGNINSTLTLESNGTANLFSGATAHTIQIGIGAATQTVKIGSNNGASSLVLNAGTGGLSLQTQGTGILGIGNNAVAQSIAIGNTTGATSVGINAGTAGLALDTTGGITFGATNATGISIGHGTIATAITGNASITNTNATTTLAISSNTTPTTALAVINDTSGTATDKLLALQASGVSKFTVDAAGNVVVGSSAGTGSLTNNGSTVNSTLNISSASGVFGANTATVDLYTAFAVTSTAANQAFTIPAPTASTAYGRVIYVTNAGTNSFVFGGATDSLLTAQLNPGATASMVWANVNGTGKWTYAGADGNGILNQSSQQTSATFNIDGSGTSATSFIAPSFQRATAGQLLIGTTSTTTSLQLGSSNAVGTSAVVVDSGAGTIAIGSSDNARTINIGNISGGTSTQTINLGATGATASASAIQIGVSTGATQTVAIGSTSAASVTTINGGSTNTGVGAISLQAGTSGLITIGTTNSNSVTLGTTAGLVTSNSSITLAATKTINFTGDTTANRPSSPTAGMVYFDTTTKQLLVYANGKWQAASRTANKIVAASNSSQVLKDSADYVATGTGDQATINSALTAAAGGRVYLAEGTYYLTAAVSVPNNTILQGAGSSTLLTVANAQNGTFNFIENNDQTSTSNNVVVRDLAIDGNKANQTAGQMNGISFTSLGGGTASLGTTREGGYISSVTVKNLYGTGGATGILLTSAANFRIENSSIILNGAIGIRVNNSTYVTVTGNILNGNGISVGASAGIDLKGTTNYTTVVSNTLESNGTSGINVGGTNNTVTGNTVTLSGYGINLDTSSLYNVVSGNTVRGTTSIGIRLNSANYSTITGNNIYSTGGNTDNNGIYLVTSANNTITNNTILDSSATTTNYAINITTTGSVNNYLSGNTLGGATINNVATSTTYGGQSDGSNYIITPGQGITETATAASTISTTAGALTLQGAGGVTINSTNVAAGSSAISIKSGDASAGTAGSVTLDTGSSSTGNSVLNLGTTNAATIGLGNANTATVTTINGGSTATGVGAVSIQAAGTGLISIGTANSNSIKIGSTTVGSTTLQSAGGTIITNANTTNTATITGTGNPAASTNATLVVNNNAGTPSGNLLALQSAGTNKFTVDVNGNVTIGSTAGTGSVTNNGTTINTVNTGITNFASNGTLSQTAVDNYTYTAIPQTTAGIAISIPAPTASTVYGRLIYITNTGTASFTFGGTADTLLTASLNPGATAGLVWANVNGTAKWTYAGSDGSGILNQTTLQSNANFNIQGASGTVTATIQGTSGQEIALFKTSAGTTTVDIDQNGKLSASAGVDILGSVNQTGGAINQTNGSSTNSSIFDQTFTNTNITNTVASIYTHTISLVGTANSSGGTNNLYGVSLYPVAPLTGNNFYGFDIGTGFTDILRYNNTQLIKGDGTLNNNIFAPSVNYSNLQSVTNLTASSSFKVAANTGLFDVASSGALNIGTTNATSIVMGNTSTTAYKVQANSSSFQANADNATTLAVNNSAGANILSVDTTNTSSGLNLATNGGAESGTTNWTAFGGSTVSQDITSGEYASGTASIKSVNSSANKGAKYAVSLTSGQLYNVSFSVKSSSGTPTFSVFYSTNGTSSAAACNAGSYDSVNVATKFVKYTCTFTATTTASAYVVITQTDATSRNLFLDNLAIVAQTTTANTQDTGVIKIGGASSQGLTLLQLDSFAGNPFTGANASLAGSLYFDTTQNKIQCYDGSAWGACGAAPNSNITLTPEYTGAVLHGLNDAYGSGTDKNIGTLNSDFCGNGGGLSVNTTYCSTSGEARNFYSWTTVQTNYQSYSIYVTYKLPSTFKAFVGNTQLTGRVDNTTNAGVNYSVYRSTGTAITQCGGGSTPTNVVGWSGSAASGSTNTWTPATINPATSCSFAANDSVIFKIDAVSKSSANAYIENLNFSFSNQ